MAGEEAFDLRVIGELQDQIGAEAMQDILRRLTANGGLLIPVILDAGQPIGERTEAAHSLKGACAVVGMSRLAAFCQEIETAWGDGLNDQAERLAAGLPALFAADREQLARFFLAPPAA